MDIGEGIVSGKDLIAAKNKRNKEYIFEKIYNDVQERYEAEGWIVDKNLKEYVRMKKIKPFDEIFENRVWLVFEKLGFKYMNKDRYFKMAYDLKNNNLTQQIDVFAVDDETVLVIECKAADEIRKGNFKKEIEAIGGRKEGLIKVIRDQYKLSGRKIKFILATQNYIITPQDKIRLENFDILHFDEDSINYYSELVKHLGHCARYQLLGNLFAGQKIPGIDNKIPAIEGKMGGHTYYSFSIEPEKLLKIGYVLHRNEAHRNMMPTYQRLIKKSRLNEIQSFVDSGGFFPNSIIINLDTGSRGIQFDRASAQVEGAISRIGILHLPQKYRAAYIIDGQHRLYGYANSKYKESNSIPVVAFENLEKEEQIKLFMDINEKQKAVSKNLRNTLNSDLLWDSPDLSKQRHALRLHIAQQLGEDKSSPLYGHIIVGENEKTHQCCITIDTIEGALKSCNFFSVFDKSNSITKDGTFDGGNNDTTLNKFFPFIVNCLDYIKDNLSDEWEKGENEGGILTINNGIYGILKILNDIVEHLKVHKFINPKQSKIESIMSEMMYYLDPMIEFYITLSIEERKEMRKSYGSGGKAKYWHILQKSIADKRPEFSPAGMTEWWRDNAKQFNVESYKMIMDIEKYIKEDFEQKLKGKYGSEWLTKGLPRSVYTRAYESLAKHNYEKEENDKNITQWDCVTINDCRAIATYGSNWSELFEKTYTMPGELKLKRDKMAKSEWIARLYKISKQKSQTYSVTADEYEFVKGLYLWLIGPTDV